MKRLHLSYLAAAALTASCVSHHPSAAVRPAAHPIPAMERQIQNAIDAGDGDYRVRALRQRMATEPENIAVRLELARTYREDGHPELALEHCRLAAGRFPESGEAQLALARALRDTGQRKSAIEGLENFLKAHPQTGPEFFSWLGILRDESGLWAIGEVAHRAALEQNSKLDYLHNNLGYNLLKQGKNEEAAGEFREALKLNPQSAVARNNLGVSLANSDAKEQAVLNWQSATDPATAHNNLAAFLIEERKFVEARKELEVALGYNRQHLAALKNLALVSRMDGNPAAVTLRPTETRWMHWKSSFRKLFVGPLNEQPAGAVKTASAQ